MREKKLSAYKSRIKKMRTVCVLSVLIFCFPVFLFAQQRTVNGKVTDNLGIPLVGVSVQEGNSKHGVFTDEKGLFSIEINLGGGRDADLHISYVGYVSQKVSVEGKTAVSVVLQPASVSLNDVVVVGYGTQRRKDLTGSISSVSGSAIKDLPTTDVATALQGKAAGVEVVNSSGGEPGATPAIIIRGLSSLNQPAPLYIVDGVRQSDASTVNVADIASIDVLKDASAAAIYGAAAAGGVIIITTRKGNSVDKKPNVYFNYRYGASTPKTVQLLDRNGYIKMENLINPQYFSTATQTDTLPNTNWTNTLYRHGIEENYNLSVAGSSPVVNYLFSGFYNDQKGVFIQNYSNIAGARVNTDYTLGKYIKIGEQLAVSQRKGQPVNPTFPQMYNAPFRTLPIIPVYNSDGSYGTVPPGYGIAFGGPNPYGEVMSSQILDIKNNLQGNVYGEVKLPFHLTFRTTWGYSYYNESYNYFQNAVNFGPSSPTINSLTKWNTTSDQTLDNFVLTYDQTFGKNNINAMAGFEQIQSGYNNVYAAVAANGENNYSYLPTSQSVISIPAGSDNYDNQGLIKSFFGRLNYNYDNRYYLSGSIRQDANYTVFGPNKQKGVFGSVSGSWNVSDEKFFKSLLPVINQLKLRASWGTLGNSNIPAYEYSSTYSPFQGTSGAANSGQNFYPNGPLLVANSTGANMPNPDLHWETIYETNIGLDAQAFNGKLYLTAEWYNRKTQNMLYNLPLPLSSGFSSYFVNIGEVQSKGVDLLLGYKDKVGKLGYDVSVTAGFNSNKVLNLDGITNSQIFDGMNYYNNLDQSGYNMMGQNTLTITEAGHPFGSFYGYKALGIFKTDADAAKQQVNGVQSQAGDLQFQDLNGDGNITSADRQIIGNPNPKLVYGINIRLTYAGFDVQLLFNGVQGVSLFNGVKAYEEFPFSDGNTTGKVFGDSYFGNNGLTSQPRLLQENGSLNPNNPNYNTVNSYFVENGSYLKLKNLQIGYTFSNSLLKSIGVQGARLYVMGNNLFVITKYSGLDPELGSAYSAAQASGIVGTYIGVTTRGVDAVEQYPSVKIYTVGLDINF